MTKKTLLHTLLAFPLFLAFTVSSTGCRDETDRKDRIGLLDLQKIMTELELESEFEESISAKEQSLSAKIEEQREQYENMLQSRRERMSEEVTEADISELTQFESRVNRQLQELMRRSQQELNEYRQELFNTFHERLQPMVEEIAREQNLDVVMLRRNMYLVSNEELDITDALIELIERSPENRETLSPEI